MDALIDSQSCEQNHRHGVPWKFPSLFCGQALRLNRPAGQGVVTEHAPIFSLERDIGTSQVAFFVLADQRMEEVVERGLTAVKFLPHVSAVKSLDVPLRHGSWPSLPSNAAVRHSAS